MIFMIKRHINWNAYVEYAALNCECETALSRILYTNEDLQLGVMSALTLMNENVKAASI